jgi:purine nucleosidase
MKERENTEIGKVIIDCDPGHDDAIALMLAVRGKIEMAGVTVVAGNSTLPNTLHNTLRLMAYAGASCVPIYAGCSKPLKRELYNQSGEKIHGKDGLGEQDVDETILAPQEENAVDFLIRELTESVDRITLVCIGPLTNIASAFLKEPRCKENIAKIMIMGGAVYAPGNVNSAAEFNFFIDPEAAEIVLSSGCEIYLNPLDVTMKALLYPDDIEKMIQSQDRLGNLAGRLLQHYANAYQQELGVFACPVHDAVCIGALLDPALVDYRRAAVKISTDGITAGESVADFLGNWVENVWLAHDINRDRFAGMLYKMLCQERNPDAQV